MTKLEKEAEQQAFEKYPIPQNWDSINLARNSCYEEGYIDGAKPREKRIRKVKDLIRRLITIYCDQIEYDDCHILLESDKFDNILEEARQFLEENK